MQKIQRETGLTINKIHEKEQWIDIYLNYGLHESGVFGNAEFRAYSSSTPGIHIYDTANEYQRVICTKVIREAINNTLVKIGVR